MFKVFNKTINSGEKTFLSLAGGSLPFFLTRYHEECNQPLLVCVEDHNQAEQLFHDLNFFINQDLIAFFPHWDILPYDNVSPAKDVIAARFQALFQILNLSAKIIITTPNALMQRMIPPAFFSQATFLLQPQQDYQRDDFLQKLIQLGYVRVDVVEEQGEFAVRGSIIDLFPANLENPVRLDFFDSELESIKFFDVETQSSNQILQSLVLFPMHEILFQEKFTETALTKLKDLRVDIQPVVYQELCEQIQAQIPFIGIDHLLPLYFKECATLLDYFHNSPQLVFVEQDLIIQRVQNYYEEILQEYELSKSQGDLTLNPTQLYLNQHDFKRMCAEFIPINLSKNRIERSNQEVIFPITDNSMLKNITLDEHGQTSFRNILKQIQQWHQQKAQILIIAKNHSYAEKIKQSFIEMNTLVEMMTEDSFDIHQKVLNTFLASSTHNPITICTGQLSTGFRIFNDVGETLFAIITDEEIFGYRQKQHRIKKFNLKHFLTSLDQLKEGDYVVHVEYGIGCYEGLKQIKIHENQADYLVIRFSGDDKVYVPIDKFHLVQKYAGGEHANPHLNKLGDKSWSKTKAKVQAKVADIAQELVTIYAARKAKQGITFSNNSTLMDEFAMSFPYEETEDQLRAIHDVFEDMEKNTAMDRLVCGDVGFGKTEVAIRAACKATFDGYQVGILVPTTILAQQHYETFCARFQQFPVRIGLLSRFQNSTQIKTTIEQLKEGSLDIVIGTHRLISKDVNFKNLGLLIIDEEQRFGVQHKEKLKKFRAIVDVLALSATPIPRTLHMSLAGIRDITVINTPPVDRRAIRTRVLKFNEYIIKEAIQRELRRNGQVYFIHNRVESIHEIGKYLKEHLPELRVAIAHGQMPERELEGIMFDFIHHQYDLLLATTIVESGLDIPNVNTIIINNADQFGLAQLYQLRGRVGRSALQAYAYLLVPEGKILMEDAKKRLAVLQELSDLGSGYKIAIHDLELRGAGNLLGEQQAGHISTVGFDMYTSMIEEEVKKIQQFQSPEEKMPQINHDVKIKIPFESYLPETYIEDTSQRLNAYKKIAICQSEDDLWETRSNLEDRFGKLPEIAVNLFTTVQIKILATQLQIQSIDINETELQIFFTDKFQPDPIKIMQYIQKTQSKLLPNNSIQFQQPIHNLYDLFNLLHQFKKEHFM